MSEAAAPTEEAAAPAEGKKKGGKLPIIIVLALVLAGGGFFAMKGKGKKAPVKPPVEMGTIEAIGEFTVNLQGGQTYLRAEVATLLKKGVEKKKLEEVMPAVKDAIVGCLRGWSPSELRSPSNMALLKQEICAKVNEAMEKAEPPKKGEKKEPAPEEGDSGEKKKEKKPAPEAATKEAKKVGPHGELKKFPNDWDSEEGPVLKIYFPSFATQ